MWLQKLKLFIHRKDFFYDLGASYKIKQLKLREELWREFYKQYNNLL